MFRTLDRRTRKPVYGAFRSSVPLPPLSHFGLGVPGTQRRRWVSLAVENFGLGLARSLQTVEPEDGLGVGEVALGCLLRHIGFEEVVDEPALFLDLGGQRPKAEE